MTSPAPDPRITPARGDLAAEWLRGVVAADRYAEGTRLVVRTPVAAIRKRPSPRAEQVNQGLMGEVFTAYDIQADWCWGQLETDGYVGWMATRRLASLADDPRGLDQRRVAALQAAALLRPSPRATAGWRLPMGSRVLTGGRRNGFVKAYGLNERRIGWLWEGALAGTDAPPAQDFVAIAERFVGAPYVWGGRAVSGIDCSGLVQQALAAAGVAAPRDSDMQEAQLGTPVPHAVHDMPKLERGDLVFWKGHVGVMADSDRLLHANAWHMAVEIEPLADAIARIKPVAGPPKSFRRL